jgi:hypothetical protein
MTINNKIIDIEGLKLELPSTIKKVLEYDNCLVVLLEISIDSNDVYVFDKRNGQILWTRWKNRVGNIEKVSSNLLIINKTGTLSESILKVDFGGAICYLNPCTGAFIYEEPFK